MPFMSVFGPCQVCREPFSFNPERVPSIRVNGIREPICEGCMTVANAKRVEMGLKPHPIDPLAYEAEEML